MRRVIGCALLLLFAAAAGSAQPMQRGTPVGPNPISPESFSFTVASWDCSVTSAGKATCAGSGKTWRYRLPVDDGRIEQLFVSAGSPVVFAYELTDEESSWARVTGIRPGARRAQWSRQLPGLNLATPLLHKGSVILGSISFVASVGRASGLIQWQHDDLYDGSGRTVTELAVLADAVVVTSSDASDHHDAVVVCYKLATGASCSCPAAEVR